MTAQPELSGIKRLSRKLGHRFTDHALLTQACTHRSYGTPHNERLEFLGDGLLNFIIGARLYELCPGADEGDLSRLRASLVREETLAKLARSLDVGDALRMGPGELRSGGYRRDSVLADALEAVIGALFVDAGFEVTRTVCLHVFDTLLEDLPDARTLKDAKTQLQEYLQARHRPLPEYTMLDESGPPHRRCFLMRCRLPDDDTRTEAGASSRKVAEQKAAKAMLTQLNGDYA